VVDEVEERKDNIEKRKKSGNEEKNDQQSMKFLENKERCIWRRDIRLERK
jgi:hypothetical protein